MLYWDLWAGSVVSGTYAIVAIYFKGVAMQSMRDNCRYRKSFRPLWMAVICCAAELQCLGYHRFSS